MMRAPEIVRDCAGYRRRVYDIADAMRNKPSEPNIEHARASGRGANRR